MLRRLDLRALLALEDDEPLGAHRQHDDLEPLAQGGADAVRLLLAAHHAALRQVGEHDRRAVDRLEERLDAEVVEVAERAGRDRDRQRPRRSPA